MNLVRSRFALSLKTTNVVAPQRRLQVLRGFVFQASGLLPAMTLFATAFALVMLALWGGAVAGVWVATGALGGLAFAGLTGALAWALWPSGKGCMTPDTLNAAQRPLATPERNTRPNGRR